MIYNGGTFMKFSRLKKKIKVPILKNEIFIAHIQYASLVNLFESINMQENKMLITFLP